MPNPDDIPEPPEHPIRVSDRTRVDVPVRLLWFLAVLLVCGTWGFSVAYRSATTTNADALRELTSGITSLQKQMRERDEMIAQSWTVTHQAMFVKLTEDKNPTIKFPDVSELNRLLQAIRVTR